MCSYMYAHMLSLQSKHTDLYKQAAIRNIHWSAVQCACCHCNEEVNPWCRRRVSPFRMQREPAPWPSLALSRLLLACPFALWMRQSPAYRPPAERPNQCFVHTEMPPRQHYHRPGQWRRSKREKRARKFQCHSSFNQLSKWAQWQTHSCKANAEWQICNYINIAIATRDSHRMHFDCSGLDKLTAFNALAISDAVFLYVLVR